jgi:hypothetical protein
MSTQVFNGALFEAAVLSSAIEAGIKYTSTARGKVLLKQASLHEKSPLYTSLLGQANWMIDNLLKLEGHWLTHIYAAAQSSGKIGDPRDLVLYAEASGGKRREIGISCKKDSSEIKSLRLGEGNVEQLWFKHDQKRGAVGQYETTNGFRSTLQRVHQELEDCAEEYTRFNKIPVERAEHQIFGPTINAFGDLIKDLECQHGIQFTQDLFQSVFGTKDYYLFKSGKRAIVEGYNLRGHLNVKRIPLPSRPLYLAMIDKNRNGFDRYARLFFGRGWTISYRLKNGDSRISKGVLKFTIELVGKPSSIFRIEQL